MRMNGSVDDALEVYCHASRVWFPDRRTCLAVFAVGILVEFTRRTSLTLRARQQWASSDRGVSYCLWPLDFFRGTPVRSGTCDPERRRLISSEKNIFPAG